MQLSPILTSFMVAVLYQQARLAHLIQIMMIKHICLIYKYLKEEVFAKIFLIGSQMVHSYKALILFHKALSKNGEPSLLVSHMGKICSQDNLDAKIDTFM
jgi:hypothetical protein